MDASKIKRALAQAHLTERSSTHPDGLPRETAVAHAVRDHRLDAAEEAVLRSATHTSAK